MFNLTEKIMFGVVTVVVIGLLAWAMFGATANDVSLSTVTTLNNSQTILRML